MRENEQIQLLTDLYDMASIAELLYGYNSEQCQTINREIKECSKNLTLPVTMALVGISINSMLKAASEIKKDPQKAALFAERQAIEKLNKDVERIYTSNKYFAGESFKGKNILAKLYQVIISRTFLHNGQIKQVSAKFECDAHVELETVTLRYRSTSDLNLLKENHYSLNKIPETVVKMPIGRNSIADYLNQNLNAVFGDGAKQKSIDNFFEWYDEVIPKAIHENAIAIQKEERTKRFTEEYEAESKKRKELRKQLKRHH